MSFRVDIRSEGLLEILRLVLKDVCGISLKEDKLSVSHAFSLHRKQWLTRIEVEQNLLYHYLYDIESYRNCSIDTLDKKNYEAP